MSWLWLVPGIVLGLVAGAVAGAAIVFAECTDTGWDLDACIFEAFAFVAVGAGIGAVVSLMTFAHAKATGRSAVFAVFLGISMGMFIGGIVGIVLTDDLDGGSRNSSNTPYVGLLLGGILGAASLVAVLFLNRSHGRESAA